MMNDLLLAGPLGQVSSGGGGGGGGGHLHQRQNAHNGHNHPLEHIH